MKRPRYIVVYQDRRLPLPDGEILVGRGIGCHIRFNAAEVSRQHVRLSVGRGRLIAENLSTTTGTVLNGRRITAPVSLGHGDELVLGPRRLRIEVEDVEVPAPLRPAVEPEESTRPGLGADEATRPGEIVDGVVTVDGVPTASIEFHTCPSCRARNDFGDAVCAACGYAWTGSHPSAVTGRITLTSIPTEPAPAAATPAELPVVYASDELTIDAVVTELDEAGAFVPSPLLDPTGTICELTFLPDGSHAMTVGGAVTSVKSEGLPGMYVRFSDVPPAVRAWITRWCAERQR